METILEKNYSIHAHLKWCTIGLNLIQIRVHSHTFDYMENVSQNSNHSRTDPVFCFNEVMMWQTILDDLA